MYKQKFTFADGQNKRAHTVVRQINDHVVDIFDQILDSSMMEEK
jgi:hypothetical protein